jgi:hypothetical protein
MTLQFITFGVRTTRRRAAVCAASSRAPDRSSAVSSAPWVVTTRLRRWRSSVAGLPPSKTCGRKRSGGRPWPSSRRLVGSTTGNALFDLGKVRAAAERVDEAAAALEQALERYERKRNLAMAAQVRGRLAQLREQALLA